MAIDRTWYNTLVDDDGSGTTGTIWNKAAVDSLLDAIDVSLGGWTNVAFNAANFSAVGGTWTVESGDQGTFQYRPIDDDTLLLQCVIEGSTVTAGTTYLTLVIPGGFSVVSANVWGGPIIIKDNAAFLNTGAFYLAAGASSIRIYRDIAGTTWTGGTNNCNVYLSIAIRVG